MASPPYALAALDFAYFRGASQEGLPASILHHRQIDSRCLRFAVWFRDISKVSSPNFQVVGGPFGVCFAQFRKACALFMRSVRNAGLSHMVMILASGHLEMPKASIIAMWFIGNKSLFLLSQQQVKCCKPEGMREIRACL